MSQCYSLKSPHPLLSPLCPKVCSLCLHLQCCPENRFISTIFLDSIYMSSFQSLSHIWLFVIPWTAIRQASLPITNSRSLLKLMSIDQVGDAMQPSHPLSSPSPSDFNLSQHQGHFQWVSSLHQGAQVLDFLALIRWTFVGKVTSLVIAFSPRS